MGLQTPHDAFFKEIFGRPETAADFLQNYLPPKVVAQLRLNQLERQGESFVDPELQEHFSDLLYSVPLIDKGAAYVYILFEHKSYFDLLTPFQLLRYMVRIWERSLRLDENAPLPPILPVVFYHGRTPWRGGDSFEALYTGPDELRDYWPTFEFQVTDLTQYTDDELKGEILLRAGMRLMKHIFDPRLHEALPEVFEMMVDLVHQETGLQYLHTFLRYVVAAGRQVSHVQLREILAKELSQRGDTIVETLAEQWIHEGMERGAQAVRNSTLKVLQVRFELSGEESESLAWRLAQITDMTLLEELLAHALQDISRADFERRLP